jgi:Immunity protein 8
VTVRARVVGWNLPAVGDLGSEGGRDVAQAVLPTVDRPQRFNLEVTDSDERGGKEFFEFRVHTPETLQHLLEETGALFGRGIVVVVDEYDPDRVAEAMRPAVESVEADTWEAAAFRVGSLGRWEFEGWRWYPDREELRPHPGVPAEVRDVRLLRTAIGDAFSLPMEVRFGGAQMEEEMTVPMALESPLWIRGRAGPGAVILGSSRVFALKPDAETIRSALVDATPVARAPSWELLGLSLQPLRAPGT